MQQLQALLQNGEVWRRPHWSPFIPALEEQEWNFPSSAETISCSSGMFRALQQILIRSQAEGLQLGSYTGCKAMPAVVQAKEELKLIQRKKNQTYSTHWKLRGGKEMCCFLLCCWILAEGWVFFKGSDGACKEWFSSNTYVFHTVCRRNNPMPVKSKHLILSFNHGCVGFKYRQNNGAMEKEQAMKTWSFPHPTSAPRANIHLKGLPR